MRKKIFIVIGTLLLAYLAYFLYGVFARPKSPEETKQISHQGLDVKVVYCRPYKKGRHIFGEEKDNALVPFGKYWRLGANAATEITLNKPVNFGGKSVQAGNYRMYAIPHPEFWEISLNTEVGKSGSEEPNYKLDVVKIEVPVIVLPQEVEQLEINFNANTSGVNMDVAWDKTKVQVPISLNN